MKKQYAFRSIWISALALMCCMSVYGQYTQLPECTSLVPFFEMDLSSNPNASFTTPEFNRKPGCCGNTANNDDYVSFYVTLHPDVAMFELVVAPGYADPPGAGIYNIVSGDMITPGSCGTNIPGGAPVCITGSGPHKITYLKPGNNKIKYIFRQIPKPIYPASQPTRLNCTLPLPIYGLNNISITAIGSTNCDASLSTCNTYMSCLNCDSPVFSPGANSSYPYTITYQVTGTPKAAACGSYPASGTFTITVYDPLTITADPNPAAFCSGGSVDLTSNADGGFGTYTYQWLDEGGTIVSPTNLYSANDAGIYTAMVSDGLVSPTCPASYISVPVDTASIPQVNAGPDLITCASNPTVVLNGSVQNANALWTGGLGTFNPGPTSAEATYTPHPTETGSVTLTLTSTGAGADCPNFSDQVTISISSLMNINETINPVVCYGQTTSISTVISGGVPGLPGYSYQWTTGATTSGVTVPAGTYSLTVTDSYSCSVTETYSVTQPTPINLALTSVDEVSGGDGSVSIVISGGGAPYSIVWTDALSNIVGTNVTTVSSLPYGTYTATVTDANGCTVASSVVVNTFACSGLGVNLTETDVACYGESTGSVTAVAFGGVAPFNYSYSWNTSPVSTTATVNNLPSGTYTVTVTDLTSGCYDVASITVFEPTALSNTMTHTNATTQGGNDGTATANPLGGIIPYTYLWSNAQTNQTATGLSAGVYSVQITDDNLCTLNDNVTISEPPCSDLLLFVNTTNVACNGTNTGAASLFITNGTAPFSISWSTGASGVTSISNLGANSYSVTVSDANGCVATQNFTITQPSPLSIGLAQTNITCNGDQNGTIDLTVSGGTYPQYTYSWSLEGKVIATHQDLVGLSPGTYTVTVTDENNCTVTASIGVTQPAKLGASYTYSDNPCFGNTLGSIDVTPTGGTLPYVYSWTGPSGFTSPSQDLSGLGAGMYHLNMTDGNGCTFGPMDVYINEPDLLTASAVMTNQVSCIGASDGAANLTVDGGTLPYSYAWTGPSGFTSSLEDLTNVIAGTYNVTVTDFNSCTVATNVTITTVPDVTNPTITCPGPVSVFADAGLCTASGVALGTPVTSDNCLVASVTNNAPVAFPLGATTVTWTVTDGLGNTATCNQIVTVSDNQVPTITCPAPVLVSANAGVCTATGVALGTPTTADNCSVASVTNNAPATFLLGVTTVTWTVTDGSGNTATCNQTVTVTDNQNPTITCPPLVAVFANAGACIAAPVSLGTPTTADNCSVASVTNNAPSVFPLGSTTVTWTVTDGSGNSVTCNQTVTVTDNQNPTITCPSNVAVFANATCVATGVSLGTATTADNCSVASVTNNAPAIFPLGVTTVTWTVTDGSGNVATCTQTVTVTDNTVPTITCPAPVSVVADAGVCTTTGVSLGTPTTADNCSVASVTNNAPATFPLGVTTVTWTVTDGSGNTATCTQTVTVTDNQNPVISGCPSDITVGNDPGDCGAIVNWTIPTYTDNCGASMTFTNVPGEFFAIGTTTITYTVTDGSGNVSVCTFDVTVNDTELPAITCPSPIASCNPVVSFNLPGISDNCGVSNLVQTAGLPSGTFPVGTTTNTYQVTDINGNNSTCSFNVVIHPIPVISLNPTDVSCNGFGDGSIDATLTIGTAPYVYNWSNGDATEDITGLIPGTYNLGVIDNNGCTASASTSIVEPNALSLEADNTNVSCFNGTNGAVDITVQGGTLPYAYDWSNGSVTEDVAGLIDGAIDVTVTDGNGCVINYATVITEPDTLLLTTTIYDASCTSATGSIVMEVSGGTNPYDFAWSNGTSDQNLYNVVAGTYSVDVTDANGCTNSFSGTIGTVSGLSGNLITRDVKCYGESTGEIEAVITNGYAPFTYTWSDGQSTPTATGLIAASYSVQIMDMYGCQITLNADVNQPDSLYIELTTSAYSGGYGVSAYNAADGYINAVAYGGIAPYDYSWTGSDFESTNQNIANLSAGAYTLTVIDANGCKATATSRITEPAFLEMPNGYSPNFDGDNDNFVIHGIDAYPDNTFIVYNRWGNIVYEKNDYANEWDGNNNAGEALPDGTYFVILTVMVNGDAEKTLTGYVDLRR